MKYIWSLLTLIVALIFSPFGATQNKFDTRVTGMEVPGEYIVQFKTGNGFNTSISASSLASQLAKKHGARDKDIMRVYNRAIKGFAIKLSKKQAEALSKNPNVEIVEPNRYVYASATQNNATWGLDRIDQRNRPLSGSYTYNTDASNVNIYIIDTGVRASHNDFGGRVLGGYDAVDNDNNPNDCNGHGTHVASTAAGSTWGVAKAAKIYGIRVLNCSGSGTNAGVIAGVDWVTANHNKPAVANMSLGGGASTALDNAIRNSISAGVTYAVAAGNENQNACNVSPARVDEAITVGSTTSSDARSSFSNKGSCVDIFAPGSSITAAWYTSNSATNTISGTSMASPHVAGVAALYLSENVNASPATVFNAILNAGTPGVLSSIGSGSPNLLLYSLFDGSTPPPPPPPSEKPCTDCEEYSGNLSGTGDWDAQPNGTYYYSGSGTHKGYLRGPSNADFDLQLRRWNGWGWSIVARSESTDSDEDITYTGSSGYYYWRILSYSGSGDYDFYLERP